MCILDYVLDLVVSQYVATGPSSHRHYSMAALTHRVKNNHPIPICRKFLTCTCILEIDLTLPQCLIRYLPLSFPSSSFFAPPPASVEDSSGIL
eukprot:6178656-Pleurochrysis_carterae.AAC.3